MKFKFPDTANRLCEFVFVTLYASCGLLLAVMTGNKNRFIGNFLLFSMLFLLYRLCYSMFIEIKDGRIFYSGRKFFGFKKVYFDHGLNEIITINQGTISEIKFNNGRNIRIFGDYDELLKLLSYLKEINPKLVSDVSAAKELTTQVHGSLVTGTSIAVVMLIAVFGMAAFFMFLILSMK